MKSSNSGRFQKSFHLISIFEVFRKAVVEVISKLLVPPHAPLLAHPARPPFAPPLPPLCPLCASSDGCCRRASSGAQGFAGGISRNARPLRISFVLGGLLLLESTAGWLDTIHCLGADPSNNATLRPRQIQPHQASHRESHLSQMEICIHY